MHCREFSSVPSCLVVRFKHPDFTTEEQRHEDEGEMVAWLDQGKQRRAKLAKQVPAKAYPPEEMNLNKNAAAGLAAGRTVNGALWWLADRGGEQVTGQGIDQHLAARASGSGASIAQARRDEPEDHLRAKSSTQIGCAGSWRSGMSREVSPKSSFVH